LNEITDVQQQARRYVEFEELSFEDILQVVPLYMEVFNSAPWNDGWSEQAASERMRSFARFPEFFGLKILAGGLAIGFALGWAERWVNAWQFHLYEMCILPKLQGKGYGRMLLTELEKQTREKGQTGIFLQTSAQAPAFQFYEACGYRDRGLTILAKRYVG
jgi:aminoglycoside 6'-N-acetyltransferase I